MTSKGETVQEEKRQRRSRGRRARNQKDRGISYQKEELGRPESGQGIVYRGTGAGVQERTTDQKGTVMQEKIKETETDISKYSRGITKSAGKEARKEKVRANRTATCPARKK